MSVMPLINMKTIYIYLQLRRRERTERALQVEISVESV